MSQNPFKCTLIDVLTSLTVATVYAELFKERHPEHAEAISQFSMRLQKSRQALGDVIYKNTPKAGHDGPHAA